MPQRTAEQTVLFELARSRALREGSHTEAQGANIEPNVNGHQQGQGDTAMIPNPKYDGMTGIFNMLHDALGGTLQRHIPDPSKKVR